MPTKEEIQAKSDAARLKNLLARKSKKEKLSKGNETILKTLKAKVRKAKKGKRALREVALARAPARPRAGKVSVVSLFPLPRLSRHAGWLPRGAFL